MNTKYLITFLIVFLIAPIMVGCASTAKTQAAMNQYYQQPRSIQTVSISMKSDNSSITLKGQMDITLSQPVEPKQFVDTSNDWVKGIVDFAKFGTGFYFGDKMFSNAVNSASKPPLVVEQQVPVFVPTAPVVP